MRSRRLPGALGWAIALWTAVLLGLRVFPAPHPTPGTAPVRAGLPFVEADPGPGGARLVCVSDRSGVALPPFLGTAH